MKVKVHYLFSKRDKWGSKLIAWGTDHMSDEPVTPSHIAILVQERWVFESTLESGVRVMSYPKWSELNDEVACIPCAQVYRDYSEIKNIFRDIKGKGYDWLGVMYFAGWIFLNRYMKAAIPGVNKWESQDKYFCSEAVGRLINNERYSMRAPVQLLVEFRG